MAKGRGDSKLAAAGALTLVLAVAGVLLVKEPLRSSRPVGTGLEMKHTTGEQLVRARLWEDPVAAVQRVVRDMHGLNVPGQDGYIYVSSVSGSIFRVVLTSP